jgi:hypothetical protein
VQANGLEARSKVLGLYFIGTALKSVNISIELGSGARRHVDILCMQGFTAKTFRLIFVSLCCGQAAKGQFIEPALFEQDPRKVD